VGESDLMLSVLTPLHGRLELRANGARKSKRRFPGGLPVGGRGEATVAGKGARAPGQIGRLLSFEPRADNAGIGRSLETFAYTAYSCELAEQLVTGSQEDPRVFAALVGALEGALARPTPVVLRTFELRLLDALGHLPALEFCCACGAAALKTRLAHVAFDVERGGVLCSDHAAVSFAEDGPARGRRVPTGVLRAAASLVSDAGEPSDVVEGLTPTQRRALRDLVLRIVRVHLRRPLKSSALFAQLMAPANGGGKDSLK